MKVISAAKVFDARVDADKESVVSSAEGKTGC